MSVYYDLKENVYMVEGYKNGCIYDLNAKKLYRINRELLCWINEVIKHQICLEDMDDTQLRELQELLQLQLIENSEKNHKQKEPDVENKIEFAWIEVTTKCNLKCIHCYEDSDINKNEQMTLDNFRRVVGFLKKQGIKRVQIIGGEPFVLGKTLEWMIEIAAENFSSVEIFTNGTLLNERWVGILKKNKIKVALSVYSYDETEHDKVTTVRGSWRLTNQSIELLKNNGIKYRVCNVLMKGINIGQRNTSLYQLSSERDIVRMTGRANEKLLSHELMSKQLITQETFSKELNPVLVKRNMYYHNCFSRKIYVAFDLMVYPCVMERRLKHGSLIKNDLSDILNDSIISMNKDCIEVCKECEYRYACFDCRPNSLGADVYAKPWYCTYNPYAGEWTDSENCLKKYIHSECQ